MPASSTWPARRNRRSCSISSKRNFRKTSARFVSAPKAPGARGRRSSRRSARPRVKRPFKSVSESKASQIGAISLAPRGNINYVTGHAVFEATHGTAPKYTNLDKVNPGSVILSGEMMFRHLGWNEAADLIVKGMDGAISTKRVTYDFARLMDGATELKTSEFADGIIKNM